MSGLPPAWLRDPLDADLWRILTATLSDAAPAAGEHRGASVPLRLVDRAATHGVLFLLERSAAAGTISLAEDAAALLARRRAEERLWSRALAGRLADLAVRFDHRALPFVILKGLPLGERLWGEPALRPTTDLDLLVDPSRLAEAVAIARAAGFVPLPASSRDGAGSHHLRFVKDGAVVLELHSRLASGARATADPTARSLEWTGVDAVRSRILAPDDEAVYLAAHAALHGLGRLGWLVDIVRFREVAPAGTFGPERLASAAQRLGISTAAAVGLAAAFDLAGLPPPIPVPLAGRLATRAMGMPLNPGRGRRSRSLAHLFVRAALADSGFDSVRFLARSAIRLSRRTRNAEAIAPGFADKMPVATARFPDGRFLALELAIAPETLSVGLAGRATLPPGTALLLVLPAAQQRPVRLDGCLFPLDVLFLDDGLRVVARHEGMVPPPLGVLSPRIVPPSPILFVLEAAAPCEAIRSIAVGERLWFNGLPLDLLGGPARAALAVGPPPTADAAVGRPRSGGR